MASHDVPILVETTMDPGPRPRRSQRKGGNSKRHKKCFPVVMLSLNFHIKTSEEAIKK